jgi:hypothetical protein
MLFIAMQLNYIFNQPKVSIFPACRTMKNILRSIMPTLAAAVLTAFFISCRFPYEPAPFVLPEQPYKFPGSAEMQSFFGTPDVKIAYVIKDKGHQTVYYFDNTDTSRTHKKLKKYAGYEDFDADSPLLSPDGSFVAYDLRQGLSIYGAYIQKLDPDAAPVLIAANGTEPHWWVDTAVLPHQVYVIFSDQILISSLTSGSRHTYKRKVSLSGNGSAPDPAVEIAPYPMNGGMSKDGSYICSGYQIAAFFNLSSQSPTPINSGCQVCNPSICPSIAHPDWMMFLNFAGKQSLVNPFQQNNDFPADSILGMHAFLLIADINNTVRDYVPITIMGNSYHAWQCPEWSNDSSFAAAIALADEAAATGEGVIIKGVGDRAATKETMIFTRGVGKLNFSSTPSVWINNN